jgi:hypothetical protein
MEANGDIGIYLLKVWILLTLKIADCMIMDLGRYGNGLSVEIAQLLVGHMLMYVDFR